MKLNYKELKASPFRAGRKSEVSISMAGRSGTKKEDVINTLRSVGAEVEEGDDAVILKFNNVVNVRHMTPSVWLNNENLDAVVVKKKNDDSLNEIYMIEKPDGKVVIKQGEQMNYVAELTGYIKSVETNMEIDAAYIIIGKGKPRPRRKKA